MPPDGNISQCYSELVSKVAEEPGGSERAPPGLVRWSQPMKSGEDRRAIRVDEQGWHR